MESFLILTFFLLLTYNKVVDDIFNYISCSNCESLQDINTVKSVKVDGLFIVNERCVHDNHYGMIFNIGGTTNYYIIYTTQDINTFCDDYMEYYPKIKISPDLYETNLHSIKISYINNVLNDYEIIKQSLQRQVDEIKNISISGNQMQEYYEKSNKIYQDKLLKTNGLEDKYEVIYLRLICPVDIMKCVDFLSFNQYIFEISLEKKFQTLSYFNIPRAMNNVNNYIVNEINYKTKSTLKNIYGHSLIQHPDGNPVIWEKQLTGEGTIIGCADSGIDVRSCFFRDESQDVIYSQTKTNMNHRKIVKYNDLADKVDYIRGHGTHVVGTILGENSGENQDFNGISFKSKIAFDDLGKVNEPKNIYTPEDIGKVIFTPSKNIGVRIHSNSWGLSENTYDMTAKQIDTFIYDNPNFLAIFANGNDGPRDRTVGSPATCKNCLSVGASLNADFNQESTIDKNNVLYVAYFSSRGYTNDGRIKPDIVAPGFSIRSAAASGNSSKTCSVFANQGTSMSTPLVAGAVNLIYQYLIKGYYPHGIPSSNDQFSDPKASLLKAMVIHSGRKMSGYQSNYDNIVKDITYPSRIQGFGFVTLANVLRFDDSNFNLFLKTLSIHSSENYHIFTFNIRDTTKGIKATLVWTDPPVSTGSKIVLLHNLDLRVIIGNMVTFPNRKQGIDLVNTVEQIWLDQLPPGTSKVDISIHAQSLSSIDKQEYSLVVTGSFTVDSVSLNVTDIENIDPGQPDTDVNNGDDGDGDNNNSFIYYLIVSAIILFVIIIIIFSAVSCYHRTHRNNFNPSQPIPRHPQSEPRSRLSNNIQPQTYQQQPRPYQQQSGYNPTIPAPNISNVPPRHVY